MNAAWLHGVRDLLTWVLGEDPVSPLSERAVSLPTIYDLSYEETAAALGIPVGTVRSRLNRARRKVREALGGQDPTSSNQELDP